MNSIARETVTERVECSGQLINGKTAPPIAVNVTHTRMTPASRKFILEQFKRFDHLNTEEAIEACAKFFRDKLRIGGIRSCRAEIIKALNESPGGNLR